jgi:hypothetical protein
MAEELPIQKKEGMSRGCLVAMIVVGVIAALVIVAAVVCYIYREDLVKTGTTTALNSIKTEVGNNPPAGVDTVQFNAVTEAFIQKLNDDTAAVDMVQFQALMTSVQNMMQDEKIDSAEVIDIQEAMFRYYPSLGDEFDIGMDLDEPPDMDSVMDTTAN